MASTTAARRRSVASPGSSRAVRCRSHATRRRLTRHGHPRAFLRRARVGDFWYSSDSTDVLLSFSENLRKFINEFITLNSIYELFPYSGPKYDSDKALIEIKESTNNLNTRLSNLKKINKSLNRFEENSSSLNWEELQKISAELEDDYKDN